MKIIKCLYCGKEKELPNWKNGKYCNHSCQIKYRNKFNNPMNNIETRKKASVKRKQLIKEGKVKCFGYGNNPSFSAEKNGRWKGGIGFHWSRKIGRSRSNSCEICGVSNKIKKLQVHHKNKNVRDNDVNNLIMLCTICHNKIHRKIKKNDEN